MGPAPDGPLGVRGEAPLGSSSWAVLGADFPGVRRRSCWQPAGRWLLLLWLIWTAGPDCSGGGTAGPSGPYTLAPGRCPLWLWVRLLLDVGNAAYYASSFREKSGPPGSSPTQWRALDPGDRPVCPAGGGGIFHRWSGMNGPVCREPGRSLAVRAGVSENVARIVSLPGPGGPDRVAKLHFFLPAAKQAGLYRVYFPFTGRPIKCGRPRPPPFRPQWLRDGHQRMGGLTGGQLCGDPGGGDQRGPRCTSTPAI